jgi:hypothetical protein
MPRMTIAAIARNTAEAARPDAAAATHFSERDCGALKT